MNESNLYNYIELTKKLSRETLDLITAESEEDFDKAFDNWLTQAIAKLEANKLNYESLDENGLSAVLAASLSTGEISVTQEQNSNGHVDLTVKLNNSSPQRTKLGEAKIWRGKEYHVKGLDQLLNRYTTGRESRGFVISYVKQKDIKGLFESLRNYIDEEKPFDLDDVCKDHNVRWAFISIHKHNSGELTPICHIGCNLYLESKI
jgi:hypothetical protein